MVLFFPGRRPPDVMDDSGGSVLVLTFVRLAAELVPGRAVVVVGLRRAERSVAVVVTLC